MVAQFLRPDADDVDGGWTNEVGGTTLFGSVDESSFSDTDYIKSSGSPNDKVKLRLSDPTATVAEPVIIRFRCRHEIAGDANVIARLFEGTTQRTWFQLTISDTFATYTHQLNSDEFASIGDFTNLFIEFESNPDIQLFAWGLNHYQKAGNTTNGGNLGDLTKIDRSSPVQVSNGFNFDFISGGTNHTIGIRDGKLYTWGVNFAGELGLGHLIDKSSPCQVGSLTTWKQGGGGNYFTAMTTTDGKLFTWGENSFGRIGRGTSGIHYSSPVQVGADTNWEMVGVGYAHCLGIKGGKLYAWGWNGHGQLGLNDILPRSSPVQVGAGTNWAKVIGSWSSSFGLTTDGKIYAWGNNGSGELGQGDLVKRSVPVQIGTRTDWADITTAFGFWAAGMLTNGQVFGWGHDAGQFGRNVAPGDVMTPTRIFADRKLVKMAVPGADFTFFVIDAEGRLWASGTSTWGELGNGTGGIGVRISSPVQVGSLTTWVDVSCTYYSVFGRRT